MLRWTMRGALPVWDLTDFEATYFAMMVPKELFPQDLLHGFALRQLIDQLIQKANFAHRRFRNVFHRDTTYHTFIDIREESGKALPQRRLRSLSDSAVGRRTASGYTRLTKEQFGRPPL